MSTTAPNPTITMRVLSRETAKVLDQLPERYSGVVITRDGVPVARLSPLSVFERAMYQALIDQGIDPFDPPAIDPTWKPLPRVAPGEKSVSDFLMEDRHSYYDEP